MPDGQQTQRYRVIDKIAAGGMAEVFRAESAGIEGFKKKVAIKRVLPHLSQKRRFMSMFLDEARLSAHLSHSNVVQVFDIGMGDDTYFIVMEYVDGADLKAIIETLRKRKQVFPLEAAVYIATRICDGLAYAHDLVDGRGNPFGIVHRDMSPPNVLITRYGEIKITDFGLAKANNQLEKSEPGIIKGKFSYLAPEAAMGHEADKRVDIFAVGIILWEMLAGRKLFLGASDYETVKLVQQANIPSLSEINHKVPPGLERIILKSLARDLNQRYGHALELAADLNAFLYHHGQPVGPWDIARLVKEALDERERQKPASANIIDQLIKQALFEFTSLGTPQEQSGASPGGRTTPTGTPSPLDAGGARDWESEILINNPYGPGKSPTNDDRLLSSLQDIQVGNLSALEDMPSPGASSTKRKAESAPAPALPAPPRPGMPSQPLEPVEEPAPPAKKSSLTLIIVVIVVLLGAAGAAGAYYAQMMPQ
jgi:eukaryotic-like serine/threonine-protein kinase